MDSADRLYCDAMRARYGSKKYLPEFAVWQGMIRRCGNPDAKDFASYGGRGIHVCEAWLGPAGFWRFFEHVGNRPDGLTIERVDVNRGYEPGNVRWATWTEQNNNTRRSRWVVVDGIRRTAAEWAREVGLPRQVITNRLTRGWDQSAAVRGRRGESMAKAHSRLGK